MPLFSPVVRGLHRTITRSMHETLPVVSHRGKKSCISSGTRKESDSETALNLPRADDVVVMMCNVLCICVRATRIRLHKRSKRVGEHDGKASHKCRERRALARRSLEAGGLAGRGLEEGVWKPQARRVLSKIGWAEIVRAGRWVRGGGADECHRSCVQRSPTGWQLAAGNLIDLSLSTAHQPTYYANKSNMLLPHCQRLGVGVSSSSRTITKPDAVTACRELMVLQTTIAEEYVISNCVRSSALFSVVPMVHEQKKTTCPHL